jgi:two-component system, NtrC family, response regulator AtoC
MKGRQGARKAGARERYVLAVLGEEDEVEIPLPAAGVVTLGRGAECDVTIDDPSVSRNHAILRIGSSLILEDAGSSNGTRLRRPRSASPGVDTTKMADEISELRAREPVTIEPGRLIHLGSVIVVVRAVPVAEDEEEDVALDGGCRDPQMAEVYRVAGRVAPSEATVLLLGETGVGKEVLATHIHRLSPRAKRRLLQINCAALPEALLEAELFGAEQGAYTGAVRDRAGLLESADGGTVLLDEIGELPLGTQAKLLRVLEERRVLRLGARTSKAIDVRFIAATNRDLDEEVAAGRFRRDLLFRLNVVSIEIPPLRERPSDIETLARHFLRELRRNETPELSTEALDALKRHSWPGNVRELRNVLERALLMCEGRVIEPRHLPSMLGARRDAEEKRARPTVPVPADCASPMESLRDIQRVADERERETILEALAQCGGNQTRAAKVLGISRRTLVARIEAYGAPRPRKTPS